jgi:transcriptional regulator of arginine metabolism
MRYSRHNKILEIINEHEIDTQEKLAEMLKNSGFEVTQATVSRDIKELHLVKTLTSSGKHKYTVAGNFDPPLTDRFINIFRETVQSVECSANLIVVKTLPGCANAAAEAIDSLSFPHILGSVAGDNTMLIVVDEAENAPTLVAHFNELAQ